MEPVNEANDQFAKASTKFAIESYANIRKEGNFVFSPASIQLAMTLTSFGAAGDTKEEILKGLRMPKGFADSHAIATNCEALMKEMQETTFFKIANKMYLMRGYTPKPTFDSLAKKSFASETQVLDFSKSEESAAVINSWVEKFSNNKIKDIVDAKDLDALTTLILVNGIYFKATWSEQFFTGCTRPAPFYMDGGRVVENVSFMNHRNHIPYAAIKELDATAIQLSFKKPPHPDDRWAMTSDVYMLIILPNRQRTRSGISSFEDKFKRVDFDSILKQFRVEYVTMKIPKFKIETDVDMDVLKDALMKMGMQKLFSDPDFSNLLEQELMPMNDLFKVSHKAFIEVNKNGAEACAVTVPRFRGGGCPPPPKEFTADHPFLFAIMKKNKITFLGRVTEF